MDKLFAVSAYSRAAGGDFAGKPCVSFSRARVMSASISADAALRGILASLRAMREICVSCAGASMTPAERALRQAELDALKDDVSRLSGSVAGMEFFEISLGAGDGELGDARRIDESIDRISRMFGAPEAGNDAKLEGWMNEVLRRKDLNSI